VTCRFTSGPKAGQQGTVAAPPPVQAGETCQDGAGSVGVVVTGAPAPAGSSPGASSPAPGPPTPLPH
jgi:hypothetical protein